MLRSQYRLLRFLILVLHGLKPPARLGLREGAAGVSEVKKRLTREANFDTLRKFVLNAERQEASRKRVDFSPE